VVNFATVLLGPLVGPECRRAVGRGWLIIIRALAGCVLVAVAAGAMWWWWIENSIDVNTSRPYMTLRGCITMIEWISIVIALVMGPALLGGSLAGERERGALGLLLTTRVNSLEIVIGRVFGKLTQVYMVLLAGVPALILLADMAGLSLGLQLVLLALPAAVAFGGSGLAAAASANAKRGRDALLAVYIGIVFFLLAPTVSLTGLPAWLFDWVGALNPFTGVIALAWVDEPTGALVSIGEWTLLGLLGLGFAAWRLRPACLGPTDGDRALKRSRRRWRVPPLDERPMIWKELYIERADSLGRFGRWINAGFITFMLVGSATLAGIYGWYVWVQPDAGWEAWALDQMKGWVGYSGFWISCLIQLAIGLRASVGISSERERGTWDAILTSPLDGNEIVMAKLWGCLQALSGLIAATLIAWTLALVCGAIEPGTFVTWVVFLMSVGVFMAAVGVRTSLEAPTATRAMALTIGIWLAAWAAVWTITGLVTGTFLALWFFGFWAASGLGMATPAAIAWPPIPWWVASVVLPNFLFIVTTVLSVSDTRLRFDRIAGRMTEGRASLALERMIYGKPNSPVFLDETLGADRTEPDAHAKAIDASDLEETIIERI
jgi:ABC-type Na+ efflux pump permease subunit